MKNTEIDTIKQILELKNTMTELENSIESFSNRLNQAEETISEIWGMSFEITQRCKKEW